MEITFGINVLQGSTQDHILTVCPIKQQVPYELSYQCLDPLNQWGLMEIVRVRVQVHLQVNLSQTYHYAIGNSPSHQQPHERHFPLGFEQLHWRSTNVLCFFESLCACDTHHYQQNFVGFGLYQGQKRWKYEKSACLAIGENGVKVGRVRCGDVQLHICEVENLLHFIDDQTKERMLINRNQLGIHKRNSNSHIKPH